MRAFLQGVSLGILFATGIFTYVILNTPPQTIIKEKELSIPVAIEYLKSQKYKVEKDLPEVKSTTNDKIEKNVKAPAKPVTTPTTQESKTTTVTKKPESTVNKPEPVNKVNAHKLVIKEGMSSKTVAEILHKNRIIPSAAEFDAYLLGSGYSRKVQLGTFDLKSNMTYEQIRKIITKS